MRDLDLSSAEEVEKFAAGRSAERSLCTAADADVALSRLPLPPFERIHDLEVAITCFTPTARRRHRPRDQRPAAGGSERAPFRSLRPL
ncbi:MAG: hypothetical protein ACLUEQ_03885 [Cloacibacillus evryensis]